MDWNHTWQKCSLLGPDQVLLHFVLIGHPTWLPAPIKALIGRNFKDLLLRYYICMEDGIVSCQERSLQVLLLFWLIENPRWLPTAGHSLMYDPMGNKIKKNSEELLKGLLKPYRNVPYKVLIKCCYFSFWSAIQHGCHNVPRWAITGSWEPLV